MIVFSNVLKHLTLRVLAFDFAKLECFFEKKEIRNQYLIVKDGQLAGMGAHSYSKGSATGGSEEAAKYKKK